MATTHRMKQTFVCQNSHCPNGHNGQPKIFAGRYGHANLFCCPPCYWQATTGRTLSEEHRMRITENHTRTREITTCRVCGKPFVPEKKKQQHDSRACATVTRAQHLRERALRAS